MPPKVSGAKPWEFKRRKLAQVLPAGPTSLQDLARWPLDMIQSLSSQGNDDDAEVLLRLETVVKQGILLATDYSGMDCPREAMEKGMQSCNMLFGWPVDRALVCARSCDCDRVASQLLVEMSEKFDCSDSCVFSDILDRLPEVARSRMLAGVAADDAPRLDKTAAFADLAQWLDDNRAWCFDPTLTCSCLVHKKNCNVVPSQALDQATDHTAFGMASDGDGAGSSGDSISSPTFRLRINCAGVSCLPWTQEGSGEGDSSACEMAHMVWLSERKCRAEQGLEDLFFVECTPRYPIEDKIAIPLRETHTVVWVKTGPEMCGWPTRRMRVLGVGLSRRSTEWHGPVEQELVQALFEKIFHRASVMDGALLMQSSDEERFEEYAKMARVQRYFFDPIEIQHMKNDFELLTSLLPPGGVQRYRAWLQCLNESFEGNSALFDVDHHPKTGSSPGNDWPVNLRHGTIVAVTRGTNGDFNPLSWKIATSKEHLSSLGFHLFGGGGKDLKSFGVSKMAPLFDGLTMAGRKALTGNGMHLVTQGSWMFFVLGHMSKMQSTASQQASAPSQTDDAWDF